MIDGESKTVDIQESRSEKITHEYNDFLTKIDNLKNNPSVSTDEYITESGKKIKRYNFAGTDFAFLSHTVGLGIKNSNLDTSKSISGEISHWDKKKKGEANNQIACSLITNNHIAHATNGSQELILGFNQIENGGLLFALGNDGGTATEKNIVLTEMDQWNTHSPQDILKTNMCGGMYNEVLITRYNQNEQARKPDFIITFNGETNNRIEQAINYFEVPIINFQVDEYVKKNNHEIESVLTKINQNQPLDEQKEIFSQIPYLYTNRERWKNSLKNKFDDKTQETNLQQKILIVEKSIIDQQLNHNEKMAMSAIENLKTQTKLEQIQEFHNIIIELAKNSYSSESVDFLFNADVSMINKWYQGSYEILIKTLTIASPDIKNFYQKQAIQFSENIKNLSTQQIKEELTNFQKSTIVLNSNKPLIRSKDIGGYDVIENPRKYLDKHEELNEPLHEIFLAQEQLKNTILSGLKQKEQQDKQKQIDSQNAELEAVSSNVGEMVSLYDTYNQYNHHDFRETILNKIEERLMDNKRTKTEIIRDIRTNHKILISNLSIIGFCKNLSNKDENKEKIYFLLTDPEQIPELPQKIKISDSNIVIRDSSGYDQKSKIVNFINSDGQESLFKIYEGNNSSYILKKPDNYTEDTLKTINKKWFWRLRRQIPKLSNTNTYQLNPNSIDSPLLVRKKDKWYLIDNFSVQKINMANFNIETGQELQ